MTDTELKIQQIKSLISWHDEQINMLLSEQSALQEDSQDERQLPLLMDYRLALLPTRLP